MASTKTISLVSENLQLRSQLSALFKDTEGYEFSSTDTFPSNPTEGELILCEQSLLPLTFFSEGVGSKAKFYLWVLFRSFDEEKIIRVIHLGASDYLVSPYTAPTLKAKVEAFFLSTYKIVGVIPETLFFGEAFLDVLHHTISFPGKSPISLTPSESGILKQLLVNKGELCLRTDLLQEVKGNLETIIPRNVDVHIASLRKKLGRYGSWIVTIRGIGYKFAEGEEEPSFGRPQL
ncbi:response regulator transcription factor [Chlamydiifrater volucris]|uniref:response regulator transcription factor n=1 Tax=Chlamydiifrater volucris TaxID=2681470 RepID=UPI001BCF8BE5|nr:response regulator transcription factor [Chlamydiifrater volucris]